MPAERLNLAPEDIRFLLERDKLLERYDTAAENLLQVCEMVRTDIDLEEPKSAAALKTAAELLYLESNLLSNPDFAMHLLIQYEEIIRRVKATKSKLEEYLSNEANQVYEIPRRVIHAASVHSSLETLIQTYTQTGVTLVQGLLAY
jgi:hypothetical protein